MPRGVPVAEPATYQVHEIPTIDGVAEELLRASPFGPYSSKPVTPGGDHSAQTPGRLLSYGLTGLSPRDGPRVDSWLKIKLVSS